MDRTTVGNGTDFFSAEHDSAWFLGAKEIRYCLRYSPEFGVSLEEARKAIHNAFVAWRRYLHKKQVNVRKLHPERELKLGDPEIRLNSREIEKCDGSEDLTFYLDTSDDLVREELKHYEKPIGVSLRTAYDPRTGWGKGFIWIARVGLYGDFPYYVMGSLSTIVMHELGHVAGCGHVGGTVMEENIFRTIEVYHRRDIAMIYRDRYFIDNWGRSSSESSRELLLCEDCEYEEPEFNLNFVESSFFERVSARSFPGAGLAVSLEGKPEFARELRFRLRAFEPGFGVSKDKDLYSESFAIENISRVATFTGADPVFKMVFIRKGETEPTEIVSHQEGIVSQGSVRTSRGEHMPVIIKRGADGEQFTIDYVDDRGHRQRFFTLGWLLKSYGVDY